MIEFQGIVISVSSPQNRLDNIGDGSYTFSCLLIIKKNERQIVEIWSKNKKRFIIFIIIWNYINYLNGMAIEGLIKHQDMDTIMKLLMIE